MRNYLNFEKMTQTQLKFNLTNILGPLFKNRISDVGSGNGWGPLAPPVRTSMLMEVVVLDQNVDLCLVFVQKCIYIILFIHGILEESRI